MAGAAEPYAGAARPYAGDAGVLTGETGPTGAARAGPYGRTAWAAGLYAVVAGAAGTLTREAILYSPFAYIILCVW